MKVRHFPLYSKTAQLRTTATYMFACEQAGIQINGNRMGRYFGRQNTRSGKYNKHLTFKIEPSDITLREMEDKSVGTTKLFCSPIWQALYCIETNATSIDKYLSELDPNIHNIVFKPERNNFAQLVRNELTEKELKLIRLIGTTSALSCLILLRHEMNKCYHGFSKAHLESHIAEALINLCAAGLIPNVWQDIFGIIEMGFSWSKRNHSKKLACANVFLSSLTLKLSLLESFNVLRHWQYEHEDLRFFNLIDIGETELIIQELNSIPSQQELIALKAPSERGIYWLLQKINQHREQFYKINLIAEKDRYFVLPNIRVGPM